MLARALGTSGCLTTPLPKVAHLGAFEILRWMRLEMLGSVEIIIQEQTRLFNSEGEILVDE